jgi:hypothetical protein
MLPLMAQFTTRVELHRATGEDYSNLHSAMEYQGFSRTIRSDDGFIYILPTAEYDRTGDNLTRTQVLNDARAAAASVAATFSVLVTEASARTWIGLEKV